MSSEPPRPALFDGTRWLHLTGITPALSADAAAATDRAIAELAARRRSDVSLDLNLRRRLWSDEAAAPVLRDLAARASTSSSAARTNSRS